MALQMLQTAPATLTTPESGTVMSNNVDVNQELKQFKNLSVDQGGVGNGSMDSNSNNNNNSRTSTQAEIVGNVKNYHGNFPNRRTGYGSRTYTRNNAGGASNFRGGKMTGGSERGGYKNGGSSGYNHNYNSSYNKRGYFAGYGHRGGYNNNNNNSNVVVKKDPKETSPLGSPYPNSQLNTDGGSAKSVNSIESTTPTSAVPPVVEGYFYGGDGISMVNPVQGYNNIQQPPLNQQQPQTPTIPAYNQPYYYTTYYPVEMPAEGVLAGNLAGQMQPQMCSYVGMPANGNNSTQGNSIYQNYATFNQHSNQIPSSVTMYPSHQQTEFIPQSQTVPVSQINSNQNGAIATSTSWNSDQQGQIQQGNGWPAANNNRSAASSGIGSTDSSPPYGLTYLTNPASSYATNFSYPPPPVQPHFWYAQPTAAAPPQLTPPTSTAIQVPNNMPNASPHSTGRLDSFSK